jgi:hypothetical protein
LIFLKFFFRNKNVVHFIDCRKDHLVPPCWSFWSHWAYQKMCWRKNQHTGIRGQVFAKLWKVNQACQSIWPVIDKGWNKVKFESVSAGIPNISHTDVSAGSADTEDNKKILNVSM